MITPAFVIRLAALFVLVGCVVGTQPARAAELSCPDAPAVTLDADAMRDARLAALVPRLRAMLAARPELDRCAQVELRAPREDALEIVVTLADGRSTARTVQHPDDVAPMLEGLLLMPGSPSEPAALPLATPEHAVERAPAARRGSANALRIELGLAPSARIGDGQAGVGLGVHSLFELNAWLLGVLARVDRYQPRLGGLATLNVELALLVGRRFYARSSALDLNLGPGLSFSGAGRAVTVPLQSDDPSTSPRAAGPALAARGLVGARWSLRPRAMLRPFVGLDGELSLGGSPGHAAVRAPRWSAGLSLGFTVGTV